MSAVTIVWFRHDLRLDDNPAFLEATRRGSVLPVFIWAPEEEAPWEPGSASRWWLHQSLKSLSEKLQKAGCPLVIRRGPTLKALQQVAREVHATDVVWNRRYEPAVVKRDTVIKKTLSEGRVACRKLRRQSPLRTITHCNEARESVSGFHTVLAGASCA